MRAIVRDRYGSPPDVLELRDVERPVVADDEVLVSVRASSVNPVDWHGVTGTPYVARLAEGLRGPKNPAVGVDFAGEVEAVGDDVTEFAPGDAVFGGRNGALAEYVCVRNAIAPKPANLTFEQAASVPVAAVTALQGFAPVPHMLWTVVAGLVRSQKAIAFLAKLNRDDLNVLRELIENGKVVPAIDRTYVLEQVPEALRYLGEGHARAKLVVTV